MPLFEYHCESCDKTFEKLMKKLETEAPCPNCGKPSQKAVSLFASASTSCAAPSGSGFG